MKLNPILWSLVHEWRLTLFLPLVLLFRGRIWWLLALGCTGMALGAMGSGSENRVLLGEHFHSTVVSTLYFSLAIACGAALAMAGPLPLLTREQRLAGGVAAFALFGLSDVAVYAGAVLLIVLAQQPGAFQPCCAARRWCGWGMSPTAFIWCTRRCWSRPWSCCTASCRSGPAWPSAWPPPWRRPR